MSGIASQRKPVEEIIKKHNQFFYSLAEITNIHVYGLSLSEVDIPYLKHILLIVKSAKWEFSDYKAFNSAKIKCFCKNNDIHGYDMKPSITSSGSISSSSSIGSFFIGSERVGVFLATSGSSR